MFFLNVRNCILEKEVDIEEINWGGRGAGVSMREAWRDNERKTLWHCQVVRTGSGPFTYTT